MGLPSTPLTHNVSDIDDDSGGDEEEEYNDEENMNDPKRPKTMLRAQTLEGFWHKHITRIQLMANFSAKSGSAKLGGY